MTASRYAKTTGVSTKCKMHLRHPLHTSPPKNLDGKKKREQIGYPKYSLIFCCLKLKAMTIPLLTNALEGLITTSR